MPNAQAHDLLVHHQIGLDRYSVGLNKKILSKLAKVEADIVSKLQTMPEPESGTLGVSHSTRQHLQAVLAQVQATAVEAAAVINSTLETELGDLAVHEVEWASKTYKAALPFDTNFTAPAPQLLKAIVTTRPLTGKYIKDWVEQIPESIRQKIHDNAMIGIMEGEGVSDIVKRIRGTRANGYRDGVFQGTRRGVETLVRTSVNHVSNAAHKAFLDDNADVFDRYQWLSVLDARTTPICRSRAGRVYSNTSSSTSSPIPPAHANCRSTIAPVVIGEEVEPVNDFAKWLADQPEDTQKDILGPARHKLWKDGRVTIDKFVSDQGKPFTLDQLKANDESAWSKAFGAKSVSQVKVNPGAVQNVTPPAPVQSVAKSKVKPEHKVSAVPPVDPVPDAPPPPPPVDPKVEAKAALSLMSTNGQVKMPFAQSSGESVLMAKKYGGSSGELVKANGVVADVPLEKLKLVYGDMVTAGQVENLIDIFNPDFPVIATKIGDDFHLIEGKSAVMAAQLLKLNAIKVKYLDASEAAAKELKEQAEAKAKAEAAAKAAKLAQAKKDAEQKKALEKKLAGVQAKIAKIEANKADYRKRFAENNRGTVEEKRKKRAKLYKRLDAKRAATPPPEDLLEEYRAMGAWERDTAFGLARNLNRAQSGAIKKYTGSNYQAMNGYMRGVRDAVDEQTYLDVINALEALETPEAMIKQDVVLWRGSAFQKSELFVGGLIEDPAIMSFSANRSTSIGFMGGGGGVDFETALVKVVARKGDKGWLSVNGNTNYQSEYEVVRKPSTFRVLEIEEVAGRYGGTVKQVTVEIVEEEDLIKAGIIEKAPK